MFESEWLYLPNTISFIERLRHLFLHDGRAVRRAVKCCVLDRGRSLESEEEEGNGPVLGAQRQDTQYRCITDAGGRH